MLSVAGCSSFVAAESSGAETEPTSDDETGQGTTSSEDSASTNPTSGADSDSGDPGPTTDPTTDPTTTGNATTDPTGSETTAGNDESTGSDSTGSDPTDASSTGDPPEACGDEIKQVNEDCDDGNADELDGCTSSCGLGPTAISYGMIVSTDLGGGSSTTGISDNTEECPPNHVLVGLQGDLTSEPWLGVIAGICRPAALTNTDPPEFATGGPAAELTEHGGFDGGGPWSTECGNDQAIVAVRGGGGSVMDGLQIRCASIDTVGAAAAYSLSPTPAARFEDLQGGAGGGMFGPLACPAGSIAAGLRTQTNSFVIQVELRCRELGLTY